MHKKNVPTMKFISLAALSAALVMVSACNIDGYINTYFEKPYTGTGGSGTDGSSISDAVYMATVGFEPDYDWQRDSAVGQAPFTISLYRDAVEVLRLESGTAKWISPDPDMVHIVDGHLITEYCDGTRTHIGIDGVRYLSFEGKEKLSGLLLEGEDIYCLTSLRADKGLRFRRNGELLLQDDEGVAFGNLSDNSYPSSGALYRDVDGKPLFCYRRGDELFCVTDGKARKLENIAECLDLKFNGGKVFSATRKMSGLSSADWRVFPLEDGASLVAGNVLGEGGGSKAWFIRDGAQPVELCDGEATIWCNAQGAVYALCRDKAGKLQLHCDSSEPEVLCKDCALISPACARTNGSGALLGVTSVAPGSKSFLYQDGERLEVDINGYIAALEWVRGGR